MSVTPSDWPNDRTGGVPPTGFANDDVPAGALTVRAATRRERRLCRAGSVADLREMSVARPREALDERRDGPFPASGALSSSCAAGTRVLTERGDVPVDTLQPGDMVVTLAGAGAVLKPVCRVTGVRIDLDRHQRPDAVAPILVAADAFASGLPSRDVSLSPDHAVFVRHTSGAPGGVLIPVNRLANGATISRVPGRGVVSYVRVELGTPEVIAAEGLPVWSRLGTDDARPRPPDETDAPFISNGPILERARASLSARAVALGARTTDDPALRIDVLGEARPAVSAGPYRWQCDIPRDAASARLLSRTFIPAEHDLSAGDARRLGVPVVALRLDGAPLRLGGVEMGRGFHELEALACGLLQWTDGDALLAVSPRPWRRRLEIDLLPLRCPYVICPATAATASARGLALVR